MPHTPTQPIALISGGNAGIGLAVTTALAATHQYHVIIGSRSATAGSSAAATLRAAGHSASSVQLDVTSDESIAAATAWITAEFGVLDVLINNAGVLLDVGAPVPGQAAREALPTRELFERTFATNVTGAACLTAACVELLQRAAVPRVVFVSSRMGSLAVSTDKGTPFYAIDYTAYDASKAAVNMLAVNYARNLEGEGGMVNAVCPGLVQTKLTGFHPWGTTVEVGAERIVELATAEKGGPTATFSSRDGPVPW